MNKFYQIVGKATTFLAGWGISVYATYNLMIFMLNNCTTLR